jgi:acyl-coenzyme A thioesterase PaaI-like protein
LRAAERRDVIGGHAAIYFALGVGRKALVDETPPPCPTGAMTAPRDLFPVTQATVDEAYDFIFAPWVKQLGLKDFQVQTGRVAATLPELDALKFSAGAVCGQAIMAAIDTVASLAVATGERPTRGTAYQHTQFLRPAKGDDFSVEANVLRFGKSTAYVEVHVLYAQSRELVAHAVLEFAF